MENRVMSALGHLRQSRMPMFSLLNAAHDVSPFGWRSGHSPSPPVRDGGHLLSASNNLSRLPYPSLHLIFYLFLFISSSSVATGYVCILSPWIQQLWKNRFSLSFSGNPFFKPECCLRGKKEIWDHPALLVSAFLLTTCPAPGTAMP